MSLDIAPAIDACQYPPMAKISPCCSPVLAGPLTKENADELASAFKALGDPGRLQLLGFIAAQPEGEACVCFLTEPTGLSQPTVSHHLKVLHAAGLLDRDKRGAWVYYRVNCGRIEDLRSALATRPARARVTKRAS